VLKLKNLILNGNAPSCTFISYINVSCVDLLHIMHIQKWYWFISQTTVYKFKNFMHVGKINIFYISYKALCLCQFLLREKQVRKIIFSYRKYIFCISSKKKNFALVKKFSKIGVSEKITIKKITSWNPEKIKRQG
jgi:hypothetical protein